MSARRAASPLLALLLAGCASTAPLPPPPPPPPPPPDIGLPGGEPLGTPEGDQAAIDRYATGHGFTYDAEMNRLALAYLLGRRAAVQVPGYQGVGRDRGMVYINVKPPYDRAAIMALAAPELRPYLQIRAVRWSAVEVTAAQDRLWQAIEHLLDSETLAYDGIKDRFEIGSNGDIAAIRAALPADLAGYTDVFAGGATILIGGVMEKGE